MKNHFVDTNIPNLDNVYSSTHHWSKVLLNHLCLQHFGFNPDAVPCIFATEAIKPQNKEKDHLILQGGEQILVLLTSHEKLPEGKYLCEKNDGTGER